MKYTNKHFFSFSCIMAIFTLFCLLFVLINLFSEKRNHTISYASEKQPYWFVLHRKSNREDFYRGIPGQKDKSFLIKTFFVKSGILKERPTPLPSLMGKEYWNIIKKHEEKDNPETAPYFLTLNIPAPTEEPYGPSPYIECNGQCQWILPGAFGLHGVGGNNEKLAKNDKGSFGCIRHSDKDISYLYSVLDPEKEEIRYYIEDN